MNITASFSQEASARLSALWRPLSSLALNAGAVAASNLVAAALGFGYWWLAARRFSPEQVGLAASAVSVMNLLAQVGEFGLGPLLLSEVPKQTRTAGALIAAALTATLGCCLCLALAYVVGARLALHDVGPILQSAPGSALFVLGVVVTGATVVIDQALIAQMRSELQAIRLGGFAIVKLAFLAAAGGLAISSATTIFTTWVAGALVSLGVLAAFSAHSRRTIWERPRVSLLRPVLGKIIGHHGLNVALQAPLLLMPFLVTQMLSARVNAAFYAAWAILGVVSLTPAALSSVVVTVARREPDAFASRFAFSLCASLAVCGTASLAFWLYSPFILALFNPQYVDIAGSSLAVLGVGTIGMAVKFHYVALGRYADRMALATLVAAVGGALELFLSTYGAASAGLHGLAKGWVIAVSLEAIPMAALMFAMAAAQKKRIILAKALAERANASG